MPRALYLVKHVVNDNGGTELASAWTLSAGDNDVTGSETGALATDQAGTYALSESTGRPATPTRASPVTTIRAVEVTSVTLGLGEDVTCTFVNDDNAPALYLAKHVVNDNGGTELASAWDLSAGANTVTGAEGGAFATAVAGTYALSESAGPDGYTNTSITCDDDPGVEVTAVTLGLGETITCTFVNDDDAPSLTLIKHVVNDNGGTELASAWTLSAGDNDVTGSETGALATDQAGTYDLSESTVAGYTNTSITCDDDPGVEVTSVTLGLGEDVTCTFVNDDNAPALYLAKHVVNDNGGTELASAWDLSAGANTVTGAEGGAFATAVAGTYALSESAGPDGYTNTSITCDDDPGVEVTAVTLGLGETITCTFVNDDDAPSLTLIKHVVNDNGGTELASAWTLSAGDNDVTGSETGALATDQAGTYALSESTVAGYTNTSITCDDDPAVEVTSVTLGLGEDVTCTFVNDDNAPALYLAKHVVNDNGGTELASAWDLSAGANTVTGAEGGAFATAVAGTYALSESAGPDGYTNTSITCDDDPGVEVTAVTLGLGETITCTFVNDDDAPSLTLIKHVVNDNGGTELASAWTLSAGDNDVTGSETGALATDQAGTYALSESTVAGYTNTSITCDDDPAVEVTSVTLGLGEDVTCTFVNDDNAPALYLAKHVVNDNGGTELASAWDLSAGANTVTGAEGGAFATAVAGTYALSESAGPDGYTNTSITCDDDPGVEVTAVTLGLGETITCTFVNDDDAPSLTLIKHVVNDNGGTELASAWTLSAGDNDVTGSETGALATDQAGTYALSESTVAGYTNTSITCDDDPAVEVTSVTLGLGEDVTCTFVNDDNAPTLKLVKVVDNGTTGATHTANEWDLTATGDGGFTETTPDAADATAIDVMAGVTYDLSESGPDGYTASDWVCTDGGTQVDATIALALDEDVTCSITNTAIQPTLTLVKVVQGGSATIADFQGQVDGVSVDWEVANDVTVGQHTASEIMNVPYYVGLDWTGDCAPDGTISVELGDALECTITNQYAELSIEKTSSYASFSMVGDQVVYTIVATNTGAATLTNVDVSDALLDGVSDWTCDPAIPVASLAAGEAITCTATYTITQADMDAGVRDNTACADSDETPEVCDDVRLREIDVTIEKTPSTNIIQTDGDAVTFTLTFSTTATANTIYSYSLVDDVYGNLFDAANPAVTNNTCATGFGQVLAPNTDYTCQFTGPVFATVDAPHRNVVTITVTDVGSGETWQPRFATASDDAVVGILEVQPTEVPSVNPTEKPSQPPTDMLPATDSGPTDSGDGSGGFMSWTLWVLLSLALILGSAFVIRRQRLAEVKNR